MPQHIHKGDVVMVTAGKDRGRTGRVLRVLPSRNKVVVEGMNLHRKAMRKSQRYPEGGIHDKEAAMDISNVMPLVDGKPTRVRFEVNPDGSKLRVAVSTGKPLGEPLRKARS